MTVFHVCWGMIPVMILTFLICYRYFKVRETFIDYSFFVLCCYFNSILSYEQSRELLDNMKGTWKSFFSFWYTPKMSLFKDRGKYLDSLVYKIKLDELMQKELSGK